ncbi:MAG: 5-bromo-4-chloroindolyl phosphate hydrolysis family protein [Lachnospiraceae bacterium]
MANKDWYHLGDDIKDIVQQAIDSQNYNTLNQTISDTIRNVTDTLKSPNRNTGPGAFPYGKNVKTPTGNKSKASSYTNTPPTAPAPSTRTAKTGVFRGFGMVFSIIGYALFGCFALITLILLLVTLTTGIRYPGITIAFSILLPILIGTGILGLFGTKMLRRTKRFKNYLHYLDGKTYCNIKMLAERTGKSNHYILRDLRDMIRRGWFLEGHIDDLGTCFITSNETFLQYEELQSHMKEQQELQKQQQASNAAKATDHPLSPEVQTVIQEGNEFLSQIRESNDAIPGFDISQKISRMELIVQKIFQRVEQEPDVITDLRKMMGYYLPTTIKLLKAYEELDRQPIQGENIISSKKEIEKTIDTLNVAFEKLLDSLFKETAWDVSSDISVLRTMLAQEGLTKDDFQTTDSKSERTPL